MLGICFCARPKPYEPRRLMRRQQSGAAVCCRFLLQRGLGRRRRPLLTTRELSRLRSAAEQVGCTDWAVVLWMSHGYEASQHLTSHVKSSPSSCPSPTHPPTYPNIEPAASNDPRFPPHDTHRLLR